VFWLAEQGVVSCGPGAVGQVPMESVQAVAALAFGLGEHGHPGADDRVEIGLRSAPESGGEAVSAVVRCHR